MLLRLHKTIIFSLILLFALPGVPVPDAGAAPVQRSVRQVNDADWEQMSSGKVFSYKDERERVPQPEAAPKERDLSFIRKIFEVLFSNASKIIVFLVLGIIVIFVIYLIAKGDRTLLFRKKAAKLPTAEEPQHEEETFLNTDWMQLLQLARDTRELALAIRYAYMYVLQKMVLSGRLKYAPEKTNHEYLKELNDEGLKPDFRQVIRQYEYAYYGHYPVSNAEYDAFNQRFDALTTKLK